MTRENGGTLAAILVIATLSVAACGLASNNEALFFMGLIGVLVSASAALLLVD